MRFFPTKITSCKLFILLSILFMRFVHTKSNSAWRYKQTILSILFMRFIYDNISKQTCLWSFNSLYEILLDPNPETKTTGLLSILFMRFQNRWPWQVIKSGSLSILFMRFEEYLHAPLVEFETAFNSLYEILCLVDISQNWNWTFNSLYEIL